MIWHRIHYFVYSTVSSAPQLWWNRKSEIENGAISIEHLSMGVQHNLFLVFKFFFFIFIKLLFLCIALGKCDPVHCVKTRRGRNQHSLAFQIPSASKDVYQHSFFPQTIRDWNDLPESLISSSEMSDDSVSKFTSLVRARD